MATPSAVATLGLYPPIEPFASDQLAVSDGHTIYWEQSGNPDGKPVVLLHGGPGGGTSPKMRRFFDPDSYRIVLFDQRGCGRSTPHGCLKANTTWDLVADIEALRNHLGVARWQVFGGSWGSTLALAYAQAHPDRVSELILRGIFTVRAEELSWFYQDGASRLFPDAWEKFIEPIPSAERGDLIQAYYRRLTGDDYRTACNAARAWSLWEGRTSRLIPDEAELFGFDDENFALVFAKIETHYFVNRGFFERDGELLDNVSRIRHIPAVIVQGRYDVICPMATAWALHKRWPESELKVVDAAGHGAFEAGTTRALVAATDGFRPSVAELSN